MADRVHERLCLEFGSDDVFYDQEDIKIGQDYERRMTSAAKNAEIMIVLIGANWQVERLHQESDAVHFDVCCPLQ